jgi:hypothetical protein
MITTSGKGTGAIATLTMISPDNIRLNDPAGFDVSLNFTANPADPSWAMLQFLSAIPGLSVTYQVGFYADLQGPGSSGSIALNLPPVKMPLGVGPNYPYSAHINGAVPTVTGVYEVGAVLTFWLDTGLGPVQMPGVAGFAGDALAMVYS